MVLGCTRDMQTTGRTDDPRMMKRVHAELLSMGMPMGRPVQADEVVPVEHLLDFDPIEGEVAPESG